MARQNCLDFGDGSAEALAVPGWRPVVSLRGALVPFQLAALTLRGVPCCRGRDRAQRKRPLHIVGTALVGVLLFAFGCATTSPRAPTRAALPKDTDKASAPVRQDLEQVTRRLESVVSRSDDLENSVARLGARVEALDRRVEQLAAALARTRASTSPSTTPKLAPLPGIPAPTPGMSSVPTAEELFQAGMTKFRAGESDAALLTFYELVASYPSHPLRENAQFLVADIFFSQKDLRGALTEFEALLAAVPKGAKTAEALLKIGLCHRGLGDETSAQRAWERLVKEYPNSEAARQARPLLRKARRR